MFRRLTAVAGALVASLALAASAHAAPTTPQLKPLPYFVCGSSLNVSWTPSTPDPGAQIIAYRLDIGDLSTGTATHKYVLPSSLSTTIGPLLNGHHYVVRVRALELTADNKWVFSWSSGDTFVRQCLQISDKIVDRYLEYNPFPECIMCDGLDILYRGDDVIQRAIKTAAPPAPERIKGIHLDPAGDMSIIIIGG